MTRPIQLHSILRLRASAILMSFLCALLFSGAAYPTVHVTLGGSLAGAPGDVIDVPIVLDNAAGVLGYFFEITFNPTVIEGVSVTVGSLTSGWGAPTYNVLPGSVSVAGLNASALAGSGSIAVVRLHILASTPNGQNVTLAMTQLELNDGGIPVTSTPGQVSVASTVLIAVPHTVFSEPGDTVQVPINVSDANGVLGYYIVLSYNSSILQYLGTNSGTLTGSWGAPVVGSQPGIVSLAAIGATPLTGQGSVVVLSFQVNSGATVGQSSPLHLDTAELNDGALSTSVQHGILTVGAAMPIRSWPLIPLFMLCGILTFRKWSRKAQSGNH